MIPVARMRVCALAVLSCGVAAAAMAQTAPTPPDPSETGRIQAGPLSLTPRFELLNVGVDSNVFNETEAPRQDFTATARPSLDATMRFGRGRLTYRSWVDVVYFQRYKNERSLNRFGEARLEARLNRFVPYATVSGLNTRERPNREIDLRARRTTTAVGGGAALLLFSRTSLVGSVRREIIRYNTRQFFRGEDLARQLDETRNSAQAGIRLALTPLTTFSVLASEEQDRFEASPERDADSLRIAPTLEFDPTALISGSVMVGYRRFSPLHATMPAYHGVVAQVTTRCTMSGWTRFDGQFTRDVDYSYDRQLPYYVRTGGGLTVTQRVGGPFDVQASALRERLQYRALLTAPQAVPEVDHTDTASAGAGYRLGQTARIGVNIEFTRRGGHGPTRPFDRRRILGSVTYEF